MNNKHTFKKAAALFLGLALTVGATGCDFVTTDNQADLEQVVATVDISGKLANEENYKAVAGDLKTIVNKLSTDVLKRDLISYYLSTGYNYVEQYGYSYADTFNMLLDGLVSREILIQNAVAYYLKKGASWEECEKFVNAKLATLETEKGKDLKEMVASEHYEVLVLQYFLSLDDANEVDYKKAEYSLKKSLNDSLDSLEANYIKAEEEDHDHEEARTLPTGVDTEKEDYLPENGYEIYTGRNAAGACGEYETVEGSTVTTRQKAYNAFLTNLQAYNLINVDKKKGEVEDTRDITKLHYYYVEFASILGQSLINKYFESLESDVSGKMNAEYVKAKYEEMLAQQEHDYAKDHSAFSTALDGVAEGSYLLYGLENYGFVSSILIPFSTAQNIQYTQAQNRGLSENDLFAVRNSIAKNIKATDLRDTWISEHDHANYSYQREDGNYYFFEDSIEENGKNEQLKHYAGNYYFRGEVDAEGKATATEELTIDQFIARFETYVIEQANLGVEDETKKATLDTPVKNTSFYTETNFKGTDGKVDYNKFTYYTGKVNFGETIKASDFLNRNSQQYKALSAVNELTFAYSTDPGSLNSYMGYAISPYTTSFVKEYEAAAQAVVKEGVGAYSVSVNQYGWHIVYCTFKFDGGEVYGGMTVENWAEEMQKEGTFANLFYETIKETAYNNHATEEQNRAIKEYDVDECVTRFEKAYKDLLEMDQ